MFRVVWSDGRLEEVPNAVKARLEEGMLVCIDDNDEPVAGFDSQGMLAFGDTAGLDVLAEDGQHDD